jgi:hypothetical protein
MFVAATPAAAQKAVKTTITGLLVDYRCYGLYPHDAAVDSAYSKCTLGGVPKGDRVAVITALGEVYFLKGNFTKYGNATIKQYIGATVTVSGNLTQVDAAAEIDTLEATATDTRRNPAPSEQVKNRKIRKGDYHEGDPRVGLMLVVDVTSASVVQPIAQ